MLHTDWVYSRVSLHFVILDLLLKAAWKCPPEKSRPLLSHRQWWLKICLSKKFAFYQIWYWHCCGLTFCLKYSSFIKTSYAEPLCRRALLCCLCVCLGIIPGRSLSSFSPAPRMDDAFFYFMPKDGDHNTIHHFSIKLRYDYSYYIHDYNCEKLQCFLNNKLKVQFALATPLAK